MVSKKIKNNLKKKGNQEPRKNITKKDEKKHSNRSLKEGLHKTKIRVIGIGNGGNSIVSEIIFRIQKADFVLANTDIRSLKGDKKIKKFQFGKNLTRGLGTGMNVEIGRLAAEEEKEKIEKLFQSQDICILISSLGGGTGCGATSVFAKIAKNSGCLSYGIFTLPFEFEGKKKMEIAKEALQKIKPYLNAYSVIPNESIFQIIDKDTPLQEALSEINKELAENLKGLIEMIYSPGVINIDFADLKAIFSSYGKLAYLKTIKIKNPKEEGNIEELISSPLYPYTIKGARGIIYNIIGDSSLRLKDVSQISRMITSSLNKNAKIIFGLNQKKRDKEKTKLTLLAVGCSIKGDLLKIEKNEAKKEKKEAVIEKDKKVLLEENEEVNKEKNILRKKRKEKEKGESKNKTSIEKEGRNGLKKRKKKKKKKKDKKKALILKENMTIKNKETEKTKIEEKDDLRLKDKEYMQSLYEDTMKRKNRKNAIEVKKEIEKEEEEILEKENIWDSPAIFRRKDKHD